MKDQIDIVIVAAMLGGLVFGLMLVAYDDGVPFALYRKLRCKLGYHKYKKKIAKVRTSLYYCQYCKKQRRHPPLKLVRGDKKDIGNTFKF